MANEITYTVTVDAGALQAVGAQSSGFIRSIAFGLVTEMRLSFSKQKSGRLYRRGRTAMHQASAPGEAPAVDTGFLTNSIQVATTGPLTAEIQIPAEYAAYLEFGTRRMAPRPYVQPAIDAITAKNAGILSSAR